MTVALAGVDRIGRAFARAKAERRLAVAIYLTVGYPRRGDTAALLGAALDGGADVLELGVPFSDPLADGATVQRASQAALEQGTTLRDCIAAARAVVAERDATVLLMGYANPFLRYGLAAFARDAADAGIAGIIVPDLPAEESAEFDAVLGPAGLARIDLYAPTTPDARLDALLPQSRGFVYCVSLTGVTGARAAVGADAATLVARVRARTALPVVLGFGISTPDQVAALRDTVDGVAIGSAALDIVAAGGGAGPDRLRGFVRDLVAAGRRA
ncbi:MAG TPA: tryptophan synthase subunit alpha [Candidatus Limnocylindria bacterium]|jgi:tryptophan synthase alpha chain